jgi:hypothetical protein
VKLILSTLAASKTERSRNVSPNARTVERMLSRLRDLSPDARTVERMLSLVSLSNSAAEIASGIGQYGRELLDAGYPDEQLHADLMRAYKAVSELGDVEREDAFLDAIDSLTGWWCPPGATLQIQSTSLPHRARS